MVRLSVAGEAFNYCAILDDYRMEEKIGEGGFGTVHLATCRENNKQYAIKYMDMTQTRKSLPSLRDKVVCIIVLMAFDPPNSKIYYSNTFLNQFGIVQNSDEV